MTTKQKEQLVEGARIAGAQPNDFWKQVEKRMDIRDKHKQIKPRPVIKN
jgi:hypothetical protein